MSQHRPTPAPRPADPWAGGWVPPRSRARITRAHVAAVGVVLLVALAGAGAWWWVAQARPAPAATVLARGAALPPSGAASPASGATPAQPVVVHVLGKVRRPGLVTLPAGARVADAIEAAGGALPGARLELNLARVVADGEQVLVGIDPPPGAAEPPPAGTSAGPLDLNSATADQLDALPGVGPVLARRIIDWRTANGPFTTVDELREVSGVGEKRFGDLAPLVRV